MGDQYFVRANDDAPEKGPFSPRQLAKSFEKSLLGAKATARRDGTDVWLPLKDVVAAFPRKKKNERSSDDANDEHALAGAPRSRGVDLLVWIGVIAGLAGVGLTIAFTRTNNPAMWPVGLILGGVYVAVRGLIRGTNRMEDE